MRSQFEGRKEETQGSPLEARREKKALGNAYTQDALASLKTPKKLPIKGSCPLP